MKGKHIIKTLLLLILFFLLMPVYNIYADGEQVAVFNASELKKALENTEGSNIKLGANITFPSTLKVDYAVEVKGGKHIINLNGYTIEHSFINSAREYDGTPIRISNGSLTINGNGGVTGGRIAIEVAGWDTLFTVNGGNYSGTSHAAIRIQGMAVLNGGNLSGGFGDVWLEGGFLIDNAGIVKKIDRTYNVPSASIINGVLSGNANLHNPLTLKNLQIPNEASLTIKDRGILNITGTISGEDKIFVDGGLFLKNGVLNLNRDILIYSDLNLNGLTIDFDANLVIHDGVKVEVNGDIINKGNISIMDRATLIGDENLTNYGTILLNNRERLIIKGITSNQGRIEEPHAPREGIPPVENDSLNNKMKKAADTLYHLRLFKGTGVDTNGTPVYSLDKKITRQEAITMVIRLMGKEKEALEGVWNHPFTDVDSWANQFVGYAYSNGLTMGVSSTKFGSRDFVSANQYITFILRALGYDDSNGDFKWDNPTVLSERIGLTNNEYKDDINDFLRGHVVIISEKALYMKLKYSNRTLLQYLVDSGAVLFDDLNSILLSHLVEYPSEFRLPSKVEVKSINSKYTIAPENLTGSFQNKQNADILLSGEEDFNNAGGGLTFNHPKGISTDGKRLLLADGNNNRILIWNTLPDNGSDKPDLVLGQTNFIENDPGETMDKMNWPVDVFTDGNKVVVADTNNFRILIWTSFPTRNGQPADLVIDSFGIISDQEAYSGDASWPWGVWTDGEKLVVTCTTLRKAFIWNTFPTMNNQRADICLTASGDFGTPRNIISDGKSLIIGDHNAENTHSPTGVFVWTKFPDKQDESYSYFMSYPPEGCGEWLKGDITEDGKFIALSEEGLLAWNELPENPNTNPDLIASNYKFRAGDGTDLAIAGNKIYISLYNGNKVVVYNSIPTSPDQVPDFAIGSPSINVNTLDTEYTITNGLPATDGKSLFIASDFDTKLYVWKHIPDESGADPDYIYSFTEEPRGISINGDRLVLATKLGTLLSWKTLPVNGEMPDEAIKMEISENISVCGVAMDDKYFYLGDETTEKVYIWSNIPKPNEEPLYTLHVEGLGRLSSDGRYLTVISNHDNGVYIYDVNKLNSNSLPIKFIGGHEMFNLPHNALVAEGKLFVADTGYHRVFVWDKIEDAIEGKKENYKLGNQEASRQPNATQSGLFNPSGLAFDGKYLWVSEFKFSFRTLRYSIQ